MNTTRIRAAPIAGTSRSFVQSCVVTPFVVVATVHDEARHPRADEVADAVGDEVDEALRGGAHLRTRLLVGVDLAGDEEEVVADAVQQDTGVDQPHPGPALPVANAK